MPKYHVSRVTQKAAVCKADKRACRYAGQQHYTSYNKAYEAQQELNQKMLEDKLDRVDNTAKTQPKEAVKLNEPSGYYGMAVDYDIDSQIEGEGYDSYSHVNGVDLNSVNIREELSYAYGVKAEEVPDSIVQEAKELGYDDIHSWSYSIEHDYYADSVNIEPPFGFKEFVEHGFHAQDKADDRAGWLQYVRNYGADTKGKSPLEAVKSYLTVNGELPANVRKATSMRQYKVKLDKITISRNAAMFTPALKPNKTVKGILVRRNADEYTLVGDASALRELRTNPRRAFGQFIVLD